MNAPITRRPDAAAPRVLVIDDAATVRLYHRKMLSDAGWQIDEAINGLEALEKVLALPAGQGYDLYVVDINMPKMDGYTFVRELRRQAGVPQAPVLMVSTEAQVHDATAAREAGANCYLIKPAKPAELVMTAALLLGDVAAAEQAAQVHHRHLQGGLPASRPAGLPGHQGVPA